MAVLKPLKVVITNYPTDQVDQLEAKNHPQDPEMGTREVPFTREIYIERDDFMEDPPKKFFRLGPGREVRLRYAYLVTCTGYETDPDTGEVTEVHCEYDPDVADEPPTMVVELVVPFFPNATCVMNPAALHVTSAAGQLPHGSSRPAAPQWSVSRLFSETAIFGYTQKSDLP